MLATVKGREKHMHVNRREKKYLHLGERISQPPQFSPPYLSPDKGASKTAPSQS